LSSWLLECRDSGSYSDCDPSEHSHRDSGSYSDRDPSEHSDRDPGSYSDRDPGDHSYRDSGGYPWSYPVALLLRVAAHSSVGTRFDKR
jgi:hypothetical protein